MTDCHAIAGMLDNPLRYVTNGNVFLKSFFKAFFFPSSDIWHQTCRDFCLAIEENHFGPAYVT